MKYLTKKKSAQKIILALLIVTSINFIAPKRVSAITWDGVAGTLLKEIVQLVDQLGDIVMGLFNNVMLGADSIAGSAMLEQDNDNLKSNSGSWLVTNMGTPEPVEGLEKNFKIPNMLYSPETIFGNRIAALDVNFLRANKYTAINDSDEAKEQAKSAASYISGTIAKWYQGFRNLAIVGLLSVLVYLGIRILISTTASDKAKYKEDLQNWLVALCLVFVIHFIMSGILMLTDNVTELLTQSDNSIYTVKAIDKDGGGNVEFNTNLTGLIRLKAKSDAWETATAYSLMYLVIVGYTAVFTIMYFKRFLYIAFLTMIAPLVALTYPIDKAGDGKAQAFNFWFKEYIMNVILQPVHLLLYMALIGSAKDLVIKNPIYALVAIGFLIPAEKFVKNMFGLNKASSTSDFGSFAKNALALEGLKKMGSAFSGKGGKGSGSGNSKIAADKDEELSSFNKIRRPELGSYEANTEGVGVRRDKDLNGSKEMSEEQQKQMEQDKLRQEKEQLGQELDDYKNNGGDIYSSTDPEIQAKQLRYQELAEQESRENEQQEQQEQVTQPRFADNQQEKAKININSDSKPKRTLKNTAKKVGGMAVKGGKKAGGMIYKGSKKVLKSGAIQKGLKTGLRAAASVGGATIGLASAIGTGDVSKVGTYMATGAAAGNQLGKVFGNGVENTITSGYQGIMNAKEKYSYAYDEKEYGTAIAKEKQDKRLNEKARKKFLNDDKEIDKYKKMKKDIGYEGKVEDLMNAAADYKEAGISDSMIKNALKIENKRDKTVGGTNHKKMIDVASFATENGYKKSDILSNKSRSDMEDAVETAVAEKDRYEVMQNIADLYGAGDFYSKNSRFKNSAQNVKQIGNGKTANNKK